MYTAQQVSLLYSVSHDFCDCYISRTNRLSFNFRCRRFGLYRKNFSDGYTTWRYVRKYLNWSFCGGFVNAWWSESTDASSFREILYNLHAETEILQKLNFFPLSLAVLFSQISLYIENIFKSFISCKHITNLREGLVIS